MSVHASEPLSPNCQTLVRTRNFEEALSGLCLPHVARHRNRLLCAMAPMLRIHKEITIRHSSHLMFSRAKQQPLVLVLRRLQPLSFQDLHPAELRLPFANAGVADAVLAAQIGDRDAGASCSFKILMICSSEKRLRFMRWSLFWARTNFNLD